jgi:hypothetical protein
MNAASKIVIEAGRTKGNYWRDLRDTTSVLLSCVP